MEWYHVWWPWLTSKCIALFVSDSWVSCLLQLWVQFVQYITNISVNMQQLNWNWIPSLVPEWDCAWWRSPPVISWTFLSDADNLQRAESEFTQQRQNFIRTLTYKCVNELSSKHPKHCMIPTAVIKYHDNVIIRTHPMSMKFTTCSLCISQIFDTI